MAALTRLAPALPRQRQPEEAGPFVVQSGGECRLELSIPEMHCAACIRSVENTLKSLIGVSSARVNLSTHRATLTWRPGAQTQGSVVAALERSGFTAVPFDAGAVDASDQEYGRFLLRCLGVAGFAAGNVMLFSVAVWAGLGGSMGLATRTVFYILSGFIAVPATLYAGLPFYRSAARALAAGRANMDVPISIAVLLALVLSLYQTAIGAPYAYFDASVTLLFFLLIGRYLDHLLRQRARGTARSLLATQSTSARRLDEAGSVHVIAARDIAVGDRLVVMPGEHLPVNAVVEAGSSEVDTSLVSGESLPAFAGPGSILGAGSLNLASALTVVARATVDNSLVAELARILEAGEQSRSHYVRLADKAARLYVPIVHTIASGVFVWWWAFSAAGLMAAMHNAIATLIITCPCALGLAVPATQMVAVGRLLRAGVLIKSGDALERLAEIDTVVLDKTGTLTLGRPAICNEVPPAVLADAAKLARGSKHPFSCAITNAAGPGVLHSDIREIPGCGLEATVEGTIWRLGRADWVGGAAPAQPNELSVWFRRGTEPATSILFADMPRRDVETFIAGLKARNLSVRMLTGDRPAPAAALAKRAGIDIWDAEVRPEDKAALIGKLAAGGAKVLMIGDGLNDAASLAVAHASMAPGSATDVTQMAADVVLVGAGLMPALLALDVAKESRRRVLQGFGFAAIYNVFAIPFGALGFVTPVISAIAMSGSSIAVMLNALRPFRGGHA